MKKSYLIFLFLIFFTTLSFGSQSIFIHKTSIYIDKSNTEFKDIKYKIFDELSSSHINFGFNNKIIVWLKFEFRNNSKKKQSTMLDMDNPLLETIELYSQDGTSIKSGMLNIKESRNTISPSFNIEIKPHSKRTYFMKIMNTTTALQFSINLVEKQEFYKKDKNKQFLIILYIGIIVAFLIYAFALYIYTKDTSYLLYSLYIVTLLFQQLTYVGFLPLYMPTGFTYIDNLIVVPKVGAVIITGIMFARSFLKTSLYKKIDRVYKIIIYAVILQILFLSTPWFYYPQVTVLTGLVFITFNYYAAFYVYNRGNKQARFFIAGWSFLLIGFSLSIIDALGIYSVMYQIPSLVLLCTTFEALFLLLAFVDKLSILQKAKSESDNKLLEELQKRNIIIEEQVTTRTKMLENLYKELHHRVKNNLQIILSIIRLQGAKFEDEILKEQFQKLENRIKSISKTHEILYLNDNIEQIDMYEYLYSLCEDIDVSFDNDQIEIQINTQERMPLREAVYVGIIINELISNSLKHAIACTHITINLEKKENDFNLYVSDDGKGYDKSLVSKQSLGLRLVRNLVTEQLAGNIEIDTSSKCEYKIRFKI